MEKWTEEKGEKFFDRQTDGSNVVGRDDMDELEKKLEKEIENRKEQSSVADDLFMMIAERLDALGERLNR